jgi:hypothetical protein
MHNDQIKVVQMFILEINIRSLNRLSFWWTNGAER